MTPVDERFLGSQHESTGLIRDVKGESEFSTVDHLQAVNEERGDNRKNRDDRNGAKLEGIVKNLEIIGRCLFLRSEQTGSWLIVRGNMVTGT